MAFASACLPGVTDPASIGSKPRTNYTIDGTHPGVSGAYYIGKAVAAVLRHWYPPLGLLPASNMVWAADSPQGNLLANGMMQGSSGSVTAPGAGTLSGTAPTGWRMSMAGTAGLTVTGSQVAGTVAGSPLYGYPTQQLAFSGSYTRVGFFERPDVRLQRTPRAVAAQPADRHAAGDRIEALIGFEIDAGNSCISFPALNFRWGGSSGFNAECYLAPRDLPNEAISGVLRTPSHVFTAPPAANSDVYLFAYAYLKSNPDGAVTAAGTIRFGQAVLQKVDE